MTDICRILIDNQCISYIFFLSLSKDLNEYLTQTSVINTIEKYLVSLNTKDSFKQWFYLKRCFSEFYRMFPSELYIECFKSARIGYTVQELEMSYSYIKDHIQNLTTHGLIISQYDIVMFHIYDYYISSKSVYGNHNKPLESAQYETLIECFNKIDVTPPSLKVDNLKPLPTKARIETINHIDLALLIINNETTDINPVSLAMIQGIPMVYKVLKYLNFQMSYETSTPLQAAVFLWSVYRHANLKTMDRTKRILQLPLHRLYQLVEWPGCYDYNEIRYVITLKSRYSSRTLEFELPDLPIEILGALLHLKFKQSSNFNIVDLQQNTMTDKLMDLLASDNINLTNSIMNLLASK